jgi:Microbial transglutaminase
VATRAPERMQPPLLSLQRLAGNRAVTQLVRAEGEAATGRADATVDAAPVVQRDPIAPGLPAGERTKKWSVTEYVAMWEKHHNVQMSAYERQQLARGCIGITNLNLRSGSSSPPLGMAFDDFAHARGVAKAINDVLAAGPTLEKFAHLVAGHPLLKQVYNVVQSLPSRDPSQWRAVIFSKRFYSNQDPDYQSAQTPMPDAYGPVTPAGQVDMSSYGYMARPRPDAPGGPSYYVNFDYGWYDEDTGNWWHANHAEPGMTVYQSTLDHYSRRLLDFDKQVFCVAFARK